jgi:hypothetical protein
MENLFRLMLLRPAVTQDKDNPSVDLTQDTPYQQKLRRAPDTRTAREAAEAASRELVASSRFVGEPDAHPLAEKLADLDRRLDALAVPDPGGVQDAIRQAFGARAGDIADDDGFTTVREHLRDSVVAIKVLQEEHSRPVEDLVRQLRLIEVVTRAAADAGFPAGREVLATLRKRTVRLPGVKLESKLSTRESADQLRKRAEAARKETQAEVTALLDKHATLRVAVAELGRVDAGSFETTPVQAEVAVLPPDDLRVVAEAGARAEYVRGLRAVELKQASRLLESKGQTPDGGATVRVDGAKGSIGGLAGKLGALTGRPGIQPRALAFTLTAEARKGVSAGLRKVLTERGLDLATMPVDRVADRLQGELAEVTAQIEAVVGHPERTSFKRVGGTVIALRSAVTTGWSLVGTGAPSTVAPLLLDGRIPQTTGEVRPAGIADLLVVRQQLTGYERADVAHVENVLRGEKKLREHTRRQETVVTTLSETEVSTSEERELESTSRFEMTRETSQTIKEDVQLKAGLQISGSYGPVVEFAVSAEGSYQRTKEEATKSASKYSQDVTERSSRKIAERVLQRATTVTTNETTEKNSHELDNTTGEGHVSGVYQWVNKVYQAQMFNYGLRAMFDFMVPEPAAFVIAAMSTAHASATTLIKPSPFTLQPSQVTESNYGYWVRLYGATDVAPPPEPYKTVSLDFKAGGGDDDTNYSHSGQVAIDEGYCATWASVGAVCTIWEGDFAVDVVVGQQWHRLGDGNLMRSMSMGDERGSVPVAISTFRCAQVAVAIEVKCRRTERAMEKWRLETHAKLTTAYRAQLAEYEEKLAQIELYAGVAIQGRNPAANRVTITDELKKSCVSILTDQHFDLFDAVESSPANGLPQADLFEAAGEGPYVRFFEQCFEWEHMTWVTYPYFWGRKSQWDERVSYEDPDPAFADFLRAGFARVTVPARPGFETAIDHFLTFGEIWNGGPLPAISSALYLPIADEIAERLGRPESEVPQGDRWTVRVPTSLVHLRPDDRLPVWEQDSDGEWVEVP